MSAEVFSPKQAAELPTILMSDGWGRLVQQSAQGRARPIVSDNDAVRGSLNDRVRCPHKQQSIDNHRTPK